MTDWEIRPAMPHELASLPALEERADTLFATVGIPLDAPPASLEELRGARCLLVAAPPEGHPVGIARIEDVGGQAHLEQLSVAPEHGRRGIGGRLVEAACAWAARAGYRSMTLMTFRDVPFNGPFYARHGFVEIDPPPELAEIVSEDRRLGLHHLGVRIVMRRSLR